VGKHPFTFVKEPHSQHLHTQTKAARANSPEVAKGNGDGEKELSSAQPFFHSQFVAFLFGLRHSASLKIKRKKNKEETHHTGWQWDGSRRAAEQQEGREIDKRSEGRGKGGWAIGWSCWQRSNR